MSCDCDYKTLYLQDMHEDLARGGASERQGRFACWVDRNGICQKVALVDGELNAWDQTGTIKESQEIGVLIQDSGDANAFGRLAFVESAGGEVGDLAARVGDGVAVGIYAGMTQKIVDFRQNFVGNSVFEFLSFVVYFRPV